MLLALDSSISIVFCSDVFMQRKPWSAMTICSLSEFVYAITFGEMFADIGKAGRVNTVRHIVLPATKPTPHA